MEEPRNDKHPIIYFKLFFQRLIYCYSKPTTPRFTFSEVQEASCISAAVNIQNNTAMIVLLNTKICQKCLNCRRLPLLLLLVKIKVAHDISVKLPTVGPYDFGALKSTLIFHIISNLKIESSSKLTIITFQLHIKDSNYEYSNLLGFLKHSWLAYSKLQNGGYSACCVLFSIGSVQCAWLKVHWLRL